MIRYNRYNKNNIPHTEYNERELAKLISRKKKLVKSKMSNETYEELKKVSNKIDEMLFIPEYILVHVDKSSQYIKIIKNGLYVNGYRYNRLLCGAGMARNNTVAFIREDFQEEIFDLLENDWDSQIKITDNKFNAYFALSSTATWTIDEDDRSMTPKVLLIKDCETKMKKLVDWVSDIDVDPDDPNFKILDKTEITKKEVELNFNFFDGSGAIDISTARKWADKLELDYVPSVFIIRNIYIKGCLFVVDFKKFAREVAHVEYVTDSKGIPQKIEDIDIILTESMFKLHNAYDSMEHYQECCYKNHNYWGVSRVSPKEDDHYVTTNYQFIQALDIRDDDVPNICKTTKEWLEGVSGMDPNQAMLFLMGSLSSRYDDADKIYNNINDKIVKALAAAPEIINDEYIRQKLIQNINKKIKESYLGKLVVKGCFSTMIPDPYAFMEWAFSDGDISKVKGLLSTRENVQEITRDGEIVYVKEESEHYSQYWNNRNVKNAVGCRSPLTFRSEVVKLNFIKNEQTEEWYQYLNSGIVYNIWSNDCMLQADSDFDGDIVFTTDDETFLKCKYYDEDNNLPITYEKKTVNKHIIDKSKLYRADLKSFNPSVGQVTNYSTSMYDLIYKYRYDESDHGKRCYNDLLYRLKYTRKAQGDAIDKAKGVKCDDYPLHWIKEQQILDTDDYDTANYKNYINEICANRKPKFFRHRYVASSIDNERTQNIVGLMYNTGQIDSTEGIEGQLMDYNSPMNKICKYMEDNLCEAKRYQRKNSIEITNLLKTNVEPLSDDNKIKFIRSLCDEYFSIKDDFKKGISKNFVNIDQCCKEMRLKSLRFFGNTEELANYVVEVCYIQKYHSSKSFAWNVFGEYLIDNIYKNKNYNIYIPIKNELGDIEYLFDNYGLERVRIDDSDI